MKISVITPSYNSGQYLDRAIQSVLNQNYNNWEHIVIDGGSSDESLEILKNYNHLKWISESDKGQSDAMNIGFEMSTGDLIVYLNADDEFYPNVFTGITEFFNSNPQAEFVFGNVKCVYPDLSGSIDVASNNLYEILDYWPCKFPLNPLTYFYRRSVQNSVGLFPVNNYFTMDYWFLLRVYKTFKIFHIPLTLGTYYYFENKSSDIERAKNSLRVVRNKFLIENPGLAVIFFFEAYLKNRLVSCFGYLSS